MHPSFGAIFSSCVSSAASSADYFRMQDQRAHHGDTLLKSARALCFEYNEGCMVLLTGHLATHDEAGRKRHAEPKALLILTFLA